MNLFKTCNNSVMFQMNGLNSLIKLHQNMNIQELKLKIQKDKAKNLSKKYGYLPYIIMKSMNMLDVLLYSYIL